MVLNVYGYWVGRVKLLKKWREFSGGGMKMTIFLRKGKPPPIGQTAGRASGQTASGHPGIRASGPPEEEEHQE